MHRLPAVLALAAFCTLLPSQTYAADTWKGKSILPAVGVPGIYEDDPGAENGKRKVNDLAFQPAEIIEDSGVWLKVRQRGIEGWVRRTEVLLTADAPAHFTQEITKQPSSWAYQMRGLAWTHNGQLDKALKDFTEAIRLSPNDAPARINRGTVWQLKKDHDKAIADFNEAIRLEPKNSSAHFNRALIWQDKKESAKALADCNEAIRLDPKNADAYLCRGDIRQDTKDFAKAIDDYTEVIRLRPRYAEAFTSRGEAWQGKKEFAKAMDDFTKAIQLDPKEPAAYNNRAWLRATAVDAKLRDGPQAKADARKAVELGGPDKWAWLDTLAAAHAECGEFAEAIKVQKECLAMMAKEKDLEKELLAEAKQRLSLYEQKKPYREKE